MKGLTHGIDNADEDYDEHIKNIYRVLMSRGRKGCLIYCVDKALENYFRYILSDDNDHARELCVLINGAKYYCVKNDL